MMQQQLAQQKAMEAAQEASVTDSSKRLQFKWAEKATSSTKSVPVKSLAQIQQEEQERIAKVKVLITFFNILLLYVNFDIYFFVCFEILLYVKYCICTKT